MKKDKSDYGPSLTCDGVNSIPISFVYHEDNSFSISNERITTLLDYFKSLETRSTLPTIKSPYSDPVLSLCTVQSESDEQKFILENDKCKCKFSRCNKMVTRRLMRNHVGKHILKGHISAHPNICGFCGGLECTVGLQPCGYGAKKV